MKRKDAALHDTLQQAHYLVTTSTDKTEISDAMLTLIRGLKTWLEAKSSQFSVNMEINDDDIEAIEGGATALEFLDQLNVAAVEDYKSQVLDGINRLREIVRHYREMAEYADDLLPYCPATGEQCNACPDADCANS